MKNTYLFLLSILITTASFTQSIEPVPGTVEHNKATRACLSVTLDPTESELSEAWEDFLKSKYSVKMGSAGFLGTGNLYEAKEVIIPAISSKAMDFYSNIEAKEEGTVLKVFAAFGYDMYVSPEETPEAYIAMKRMMTEFMSGYLPNYYQEIIVKNEKRLKKLNKSEAKLAKKLANHKEKIEELNKTIEEEGSELEETITEKKKSNEELNRHKKRLENVLKQLNKQ